MANGTDLSSNLIVLGIIIRSRRIEYGYSLRTLADITKISHTLINNIEKGKQVAAKDTLVEIFDALDLTYNEDPELLTEGRKLISKVTNLIMYHEYEMAREELYKLEENENLYLLSPLIIDYILVKYCYYVITATPFEGIDEIIDHYSKVSEFFGPIQQQLWTFIVGLNHLNNEHYNKAFEEFNNALTKGSKTYDVFIKEYLVIAMVRQYKFMDASILAKEIIKEYESKTIYIRAMKTKLQLTRVYLVIRKFSEIEEILEQVAQFCTKFNIEELVVEADMLRAVLAINRKEFDEAEKVINEMPNQDSLNVAMAKFKLYYEQGDLLSIEKIYNELIQLDAVKNHHKIPCYLKMKVMYKIPHLYVEEEYLKCVEYLCEFSVKYNDQDIIGIAYNHLLEFYYSKRQYKKAMEVSYEFLQHKRLLKIL